MTNEKRIKKVARKMAKLIIAERMAGNTANVEKLTAIALETVEAMRTGAL
jgi:hypothetical protein